MRRALGALGVAWATSSDSNALASWTDFVFLMLFKLKFGARLTG
jgi:hypothetical protein